MWVIAMLALVCGPLFSAGTSSDENVEITLLDPKWQIYIRYDRLSGSYDIMQRAAPAILNTSSCGFFQLPPLFSGKMDPGLTFLSFMRPRMTIVDFAKNNFTMYTCQWYKLLEDDPPKFLRDLCSAVTEAHFSDKFDLHISQLVRVRDTWILEFSRERSTWRLWPFNKDIAGSGDPLNTAGEPLLEGSWKNLMGGGTQELVYLGDDDLLSYSPLSGNYKLWKLDWKYSGLHNATSFMLKGGYRDPLGHSKVPKHAGRISAGHRLIGLGDGKNKKGEYTSKQLLEYAPLTAEYRVMDCDWESGSCVHVVDGFPNHRLEPNPCNYGSERPCFDNLECGWCLDPGTNKCTTKFNSCPLMGFPNCSKWWSPTPAARPTPVPTVAPTIAPTVVPVPKIHRELVEIRCVFCIPGNSMESDIDVEGEGGTPEAAEHIFTYLGEELLLDFDTKDGDYQIWHSKDFSRSCGAGFSFPRIREFESEDLPASMWNFSQHKFVSLGDGRLMDYDAQKRSFLIQDCAWTKATQDVPFPCEQWAAGEWSERVNSANEQLMLLLSQNLFIDLNKQKGTYNVWFYDKDVHSSGDPFYSTDGFGPVYEGQWHGLQDAEQHTFHYYNIDGRDLIWQYDPATADCQIWEFDVENMRHPSRMLRQVNKNKVEATQETTYNSRPVYGPFYKHTFPGKGRQLVQMGQNKILEYIPQSGKIQLWRCTTNASDVPEVPAGYTYGPMIAPFRCFLTTSTTLPKAHKSVCSHNSKGADCLNDPRCGWCESRQKCFEGWLEGPCSAECPKDWRYKAYPVTWEETYTEDPVQKENLERADPPHVGSGRGVIVNRKRSGIYRHNLAGELMLIDGFPVPEGEE